MPTPASPQTASSATVDRQMAQRREQILEAARMDGAGLWAEFRHVVLPLALGGIASTGLLCLVLSWNEAF